MPTTPAPRKRRPRSLPQGADRDEFDVAAEAPPVVIVAVHPAYCGKCGLALVGEDVPCRYCGQSLVRRFWHKLTGQA